MTEEFLPIVHAHLPSLTHLNVNAHSEHDLDRLMDFTALRKLSLWNHVKEVAPREDAGTGAGAAGTTVCLHPLHSARAQLCRRTLRGRLLDFGIAEARPVESGEGAGTPRGPGRLGS